MFRPRLGHCQALIKEHRSYANWLIKCYVVIPAAHNVCVVNLDKTDHWIYAEREDFSCDGTLKFKLKVLLVIGCPKTLNQATVYNHYNKKKSVRYRH